MVDKELLSAISDLLDEKLEQKLEEKLDQKLDQKFEEKLQPLYDRLDRVEQKVGALEQDVRHIKVVQLENNVIPRLSTIESCYLDTFQRYQEGTEKIEGMAGDIEILKRTVSEHSMKLAKLSV